MAVNPMMLPLFMALGTRDRERRRRLTQTLLPLGIPLAPAARTAVATFTIDREIRRSQRETEQLAREAHGALQKAYDSVGAKLTAQELAEFPALNSTLTKLNLQHAVVAGAGGVAFQQMVEMPAMQEAMKHAERLWQDAMKEAAREAVGKKRAAWGKARVDPDQDDDEEPNRPRK